MAGDAETSSVEILKKIRDAFDIFDHECNKTVDVRYGNNCFFEFFNIFLKFSFTAKVQSFPGQITYLVVEET